MKEMIRKILLVICVCVFAYSAYQLFLIYQNYQTIETESKVLIKEYVEETNDNNPLNRVIDFQGLKEENKDVIGWLYIPDTNIDEPILKGENNNTYLRTGIDKKKNTAGQIFIDEINNKDFKDDNTIIYGHNMRNGSRFHNLRYYVKNDFYNEHQTVYIYLPDNSVNVYQVYGAAIIDVSSDLYQKGIDYKSYVNNALKVSKIKSDVSEEESPLILLSTCYTSNSDSRYVVFGRLEKNVKTNEG